jgi:xanthine dehydrogenase YagS FAD-binding subunit
VRAFAYLRAGSLDEAVRAASAERGTRYIAGGTNLLDLMKLQIETPDRIIDIGALGLDDVVRTEGGGISIGARVTNATLAANPLVRQDYPVLAQALLAGASPQLRNKATAAGNLLQRTRCAYFYDTALPCNKRTPGSGCSAIGGANRMLAVLGTSEHCIAGHPSDMAVAMRALDASVATMRAGGTPRRIALADFYLLPGETPHIENVLEPGELITAIELPAPAPGRQLYRKVRDRASYAFALFSVAGVVAVENERIAGAALAFGGIATLPWRDAAVERALIGQTPTDATFEAAADALLRDAKVRGANGYKLPLARRTLIACLRVLTGTKT